MHKYLEYTTPDSFRSKFNPLVGIHPDHIHDFNNIFLDGIFLKLCKNLSLNCERFDFLRLEDLITEKEFEQKNAIELVKPYFYDLLFKNIFKNFNGFLINKVKYTFTFDISLTPYEIGGSRYGTIKLGEYPVLYYCYVDFQNAMNFIKNLE